LAHHFVNFGFRANVDAAGRFIENDHFRATAQPFGDQDFLLIPPGEFGDILVYRMTFQRQQFALIFSGTLLVNFMKQAHRAFIAAVFQTAADRHVLSDGKVGEKTVIPAAFSDVSHPFFHGIQG
jgi:hypothetical protein